MTIQDLIRDSGVEPCRPWPRRILSRPDWAAMASLLARDDSVVLLALWADTAHVHALLLDEPTRQVLPVSAAVESSHYAALSPARWVASSFERLIHDLWGHNAEGGSQGPWLDHGHWPLTLPLSPRPGPPSGSSQPPEFQTSEGVGLMQVPLGPIHARLEEAAHLRLTCRRETVLRAESRLGYTHKGTLALMRGKSPRAAARFAARLAGDATVAHSLAFSRATEAALDVAAPPRAAVLRAIMAELERTIGHLGDLAALAEAAGFASLDALCGLHRERLARAAAAAFGHRLMMDCVVPGGVAADVTADGEMAIERALTQVTEALTALHRGLEPLLARLAQVGVVRAATAVALGAGGVAGRAAGRLFDARAFDPIHDGLPASTETDSDGAARCRVRMAEIADSLRRVPKMLDALPAGAIVAALPNESGEGIGCAESVRGDVWHWLRLDHGQIAAVFPRDPGWALWKMAETAMTGRPIEEAELVLRSFSLAASPVDL